MSEYVSVAETAKLARAALRKAFPDVKFSVRSNRYSGGASIDVGWTDGPQTAAVDKVVQPYSGAGFDGMTDCKTSHSSWLYPDGSVGDPEGEDARLVHFCADYVFTNRTFSGEYRTELERAVVFLAGEDGPFDGNRRYEFGIIPEGETAGRCFSEYGSTLVWQVSQVDEGRLESALRREAKRRADNAVARFNREHAEDRTGFYVSVVDGRQSGVLLGPYGTKEAAEADVPEGKRLAEQVNDRAVWYAYGVTKVTMKPGADLPAGKLEHLTGRQMALASASSPVPQAA